MPEKTHISIFVALDELGDYGLGDTVENAMDDYDNCFGEKRVRRIIQIDLEVDLPVDVQSPEMKHTIKGWMVGDEKP